MAIVFECEYCDQALTAVKQNAGRRTRCPKCMRFVTVPQTENLPSIAETDLSDIEDVAEAPNKRTGLLLAIGASLLCFPACLIEMENGAFWSKAQLGAALAFCSFCGAYLFSKLGRDPAEGWTLALTAGSFGAIFVDALPQDEFL